jgi:hypothetical protein
MLSKQVWAAEASLSTSTAAAHATTAAGFAATLSGVAAFATAAAFPPPLPLLLPFTLMFAPVVDEPYEWSRFTRPDNKILNRFYGAL